jgi:exopolysaccharide biosynthesis predicted pyruvyltransferase EpsI
MKIGILTLPLHTNYGGILQAYALQTLLEHMGHRAFLIETERKYNITFWQMLRTFPKRVLDSIKEGKYRFGIKYERDLRKKQNETRCLYTSEFINRNIKLLRIKSFYELTETMFDIIIVGSDQVWRPKYANLLMGSVRHAYLDFTIGWQDIKRISYAASFGTSDWEYNSEETKTCSNLLAKFVAVSVREQSGIKLCKDNFGRQDTVTVLDPTLLFDQSFYSQLFIGKSTKSNGNLMCYVLDKNKNIDQIIEICSKKMQLTPFYVNTGWNKSPSSTENGVQISVEQWLRGFFDAEYVITDSFHACVFSILFRKQFFVIGNSKRGLTRFDALLTQFNLTERMIDHSFVDAKEWPANIDYNEVYKLLQLRREESIKFLQKYIV